MVIVEKSFPRGGTTTKEAKTSERKENIIFGALQKKIKKTKSIPKDDLVGLLEENKQDNIETVSAELLNYDTIQDGMSIMGMVKAVDSLYLSISLPGRLVARVSALEISESYTKATKEFLQQTGHVDNYKPLRDLYCIGQIVYGRVQEVKKNQHGRTEISMTLKPSEVHAELQHSNVRKGFIFNGAVEEVQEHGYIIESGIKGMRTFLPIDKSKPGHAVGELIHLKVEKMTPNKTASTCICKEIKMESLKIKNQVDPNLDYILPSTIVEFNVTKRLKDGLQGNIMNESFTAYINEHQLSEPLALPEDYEVNATLNARVLYVMPLTKLVYLSLNISSSSPTKDMSAADFSTKMTPQFKRGDVIENARVHHLGSGGVILILNNKFKGIISYRTIKANYKGNYDHDELLAKYSKKTQQKVRVLDYDLMDSMYICTDDVNVVNEKVFSLDDLLSGELCTATVKQRFPKVGGYEVQVGKVKGIIEKLFLSPSTKTLEDMSKIRCRVVAVNLERKIVYLTNRPEYMSKNCKVLTTLTDAKPNSIYTGTIVQCDGDYLLVKFFNNLKGMLHKQSLSGIMASEQDTFYIGQTMPFRIVSRNDDKIILGLADDTFSLGEICPVTVTHILESGLEIKIAFNATQEEDEGAKVEVKGLVPIRLLSDFADLIHAKLRMFPPTTETQAVCMVKNIFSVRDVSYFQKFLTKDWRSIQKGDILKAYVKNVTGDVIELMVPISDYGKLVKVHLNMLLVTAFKNPNIMLSPEQVVFVKVLNKEESTKTITVSAKLTDVWDGQLSNTAEYLASYLKEVGDIKRKFKAQGNSIAQYTIGEKVDAIFQGVNADTNDWQYELVNTKLLAVVKATFVGKVDPPKVGAKQQCVVIWIDYGNDLLFVSNKLNDIEHITTGKKIPTNLVGKSGINAKVLLKHENVFICSLKKGQNPLVYCPTRLHYNDFENSSSVNVKEGDFCKLAFVHETKPIAVLESTWKLWKDISRKRKAIEETETVKRKKAKLIKEAITEAGNQAATKDIDESKENQKQKRKLEATKKNIVKKAKKQDTSKEADVLFYEDKTSSNPIVATQTKPLNQSKILKPIKTTSGLKATEIKTLPGISDFWTTDLTQLNQNNKAALSSDEEDNDDDENEQNQGKKKKLTAGEKFKQQREEEARLRAIEEKYADPNQLPESVDQFDRLVLSDPNNSKHWINYMVFHLQSTEIDKARAVARRAIKAISFRDDSEQLNIWVALLNLELRYGSKESFDDTLKEALTYNDPLKVYLRTVEILSDAKKTQELVEMIAVITKKFKGQQDIWKAAAQAYFSIDMPERAQQLLHRALACLPEREHVNTIVIFANLNHKHGNNEMAQTLLDQVVTSYPKRVDVWTQYIDMLVKENLIDSARSVLERAVIQKIPLKKMRTVFKKYLEFEERYGSDADVQKVKKLAIDYVKNNTNL